MTKYKLLAIDLDGTLLSKFKRISQSNFKALKTYVNQGGTPVITTGRSIVSAEKFANKIADYVGNKSEYIIAFNGAYIKNLQNNEISEYKISDKIVRELHEFVIKNKLTL
jgi:HAD superfamily hydrolase (TIGR01484 family)